MKVHFIIISSMLLLVCSLGFFTLNLNSNKNEKFYQKDKDSSNGCIELADSVKTVPYKVLESSPTLAYTIFRKGNGKRIMFTEKFGARSLPNMAFYNTSGIKYSIGKKRGFDNVSFPFKCTINSSVSFEQHKFDNRPALLNDFEIIIYEPGNWEISFFN